ncbi:MAG TPA: peptidylprolyl isomerase [Candidatus Limnocylindrales bacterium]|nr:peptidylprolyl isomerase [Candidatus Limnocylindrales bacterium]
MFDLFRSREKSVRLLLGALLVLVALSMLTYLVPSYNSGGSGPGDNTVAVVGGDAISQQEVQSLIQKTMRQKQFPAEVLPNFIPQMVQQMIDDRALAYEATRLGFVVTDQDVAQAIRQMIPNLFPDGKFVGKDVYAGMLAQQDMTIAQFEDDLKRQILISRLRDVAMEGTIVTPAEIETTFRARNEKLKIKYVKISPDQFRKAIQPTTAELQQYFTTNHAQYNVPERRNLVILIADQAKIADTVNPSDAELQAIYNQNRQQFQVPERAEVRHILIKTQGKPASDDAKIKAQAEDLLKQLRAKNGANFADLAKQYSEDPGSAAKGGDLGWVQRGQMVKEFEDASFNQKVGDIDLVKSSFGYHIVQVTKREPAHLQTFDEVKPQLAAQVKSQKVSALMQEISDKAQDALQKDPTHPEAVAAKYNMQLVRADNVEQGKPVPEIGTNADFDNSTAGLKKNDVSQPVALPGNKLALAVCTDVIAPRPATFDEVQNTIRDLIVDAKSKKAAQDKAAELAAKAKSMGDLEKAAKSMGLEVKTTNDFTRTGTVEGLGAASYFTQAFAEAPGTVDGPISLPDSNVVAQVVSKTPADMSKLDEQRASIRDEIKSQKARDRNQLFEVGLRDRLIAEGKIKIHEDVIQRIIANYRTAG